MTTKMEEKYEGRFLDALDLPEGVLIPVLIEHVAEPFSEKDSSVPPKPIKSAILSFKGKQKRLILNKTGYKNLKAMFGKEPKDWLNKTIHIQRRYLASAFGSENVLCIRIVPPVGTSLLKSAIAFMGSATPYGPDGEPTPPKPKQQRTRLAKNIDASSDVDPPIIGTPGPPSPTSGFAGTLTEWKQGIDVMTTPEHCAEFRRDHLPTVPTHQMAEVEAMLGAQEMAITRGATK